MVANEVNKFGQIFPIHRRWKYKDITRVISILLISPSKVIYAELFCVKDTPHFFPKLISESLCIYVVLRVEPSKSL
jgi:hypothetical protein